MSKQKPLVRNAANESEVRAAEQKEKFTLEKEQNDLRFILSSEQGRRFVWKQLSLCGVFKTSFTGNSETFFLEGRRDIGLRLLDDIMSVDPDGFLKMMNEYKKGEI